MPPESSRQGQKLLLSLIGAVCAFLATRKIMFHSKSTVIGLNDVVQEVVDSMINKGKELFQKFMGC